MAKINRWQKLIDSINQSIASIDNINWSLKLVDEVNQSKILVGIAANERHIDRIVGPIFSVFFFAPYYRGWGRLLPFTGTPSSFPWRQSLVMWLIWPHAKQRRGPVAHGGRDIRTGHDLCDCSWSNVPDSVAARLLCHQVMLTTWLLVLSIVQLVPEVIPFHSVHSWLLQLGSGPRWWARVWLVRWQSPRFRGPSTITGLD